MDKHDKARSHRARVVEEFWVKRASEQSPEQAVHPKSRFLGYEMWTRRMVQTWTMRREDRSDYVIHERRERRNVGSCSNGFALLATR